MLGEQNDPPTDEHTGLIDTSIHSKLISNEHLRLIHEFEVLKI